MENENFRQKIIEVLQKKRPNLTTSSLKTYSSILYNISKKLDPQNTDISIFEKHEPILELLQDSPPASRKTKLSPLFVITGKEIYQQIMVANCKVVNEEYRTQQKTTKQEEGWITMQEVKLQCQRFYKNRKRRY